MIERTWMLCDTPAMPGRRQHMPRTIRSIFTPVWLALYSALIILGSVSELNLAMMCAGLPSAGELRFPGDQVEQGLLQGEGRVQQLLHAQGLAHADQLAEQLGDVLAQSARRRSAGCSRCTAGRCRRGSCRCPGVRSGPVSPFSRRRMSIILAWVLKPTTP